MMLSGAAFAGITDSRLPQGPSPAPLPDQEPGRAVTYSQGFETVIPAGWTNVNNSTPAGTNPTWFQGNTTVFNAHQGPANSYAAANFNAVAGNNTISLWLISEPINVLAGDVLSFFTRTVDAPAFPDRLEVRFSPLGTNTGGTNASVGDFTSLLTTVNPGLTLTGYPSTWTEFTANIPATSAVGRIAFRYFVTGGGPSGANSDFIGVDTMTINSIPEPASLGLVSIAAVGLFRRRRSA
jgi:hypothetical protein